MVFKRLTIGLEGIVAQVERVCYGRPILSRYYKLMQQYPIAIEGCGDKSIILHVAGPPNYGKFRKGAGHTSNYCSLLGKR
jgi:hypothetical protein